MYRVIVYDWNPNGTNDIAILGSHSRFMDCLPEALFGLNVSKFKEYDNMLPYDGGHIVPLKVVLKHIAVSPVSDGSETIKFLKKYFKSVK